MPGVTPISAELFAHDDGWWRQQETPHILGAVLRENPDSDSGTPEPMWFVPADGLSIVSANPGDVLPDALPPPLLVMIAGAQGGPQERYQGLSGSPLYILSAGQEIAVGVVLEYHGTAHGSVFKCRKLSNLGEWWAPLGQAVSAYKDGREFLRNFQIVDAKASLEASKRYFENDVGVECPEAVCKELEHLETIQKKLNDAHQLANGPLWEIWRLNKALNLLIEIDYDVKGKNMPNKWEDRFARCLVVRMFTGFKPPFSAGG